QELGRNDVSRQSSRGRLRKGSGPEHRPHRCRHDGVQSGQYVAAGHRCGPASRRSKMKKYERDIPGFNKSIDVRFRGPEMFIVDFGVFAPAPVTPNTGKVWKVVRGSCAAGGNPVIEMDDQGQPVTLMKRCEDLDH